MNGSAPTGTVGGIDLLRWVRRAPGLADCGRAARARARLRSEAIELARAEALVQAAYCWRVSGLEAPAGAHLHAGGERLHAPWLVPAAGELTALACVVCTLGDRLERRAGELFAQRRAALGLALDELGNELLFELARRAQDRVHAEVRRAGLSMAGELRAGDPGLALQEQAAVLRLAQAQRLGVQVSRAAMMHPVKSTAMVLGVGVGLPAVNWSRCDRCPSRERCAVRLRASAAAGAGAGAGAAGADRGAVAASDAA
ncbi:MAG: hypothetical protein IT508_03660 [Burkholderiaceae bacterium]|nr:hypothetical protein [Burkholderiaceae bacterium]